MIACMEEADMENSPTPGQRLHYAANWRPSEGERLPPAYDNHGLTLDYQLAMIALAKLMDMAGIVDLEVTSLEVSKFRMTTLVVQETETGGVRASVKGGSLNR